MSDKSTHEMLEKRIRELEEEISTCKRLKDELEQSREKYQTILDNIVEGYYEVDLSGNFVFFNNAMQNILGFEKDEMLGMNNREYMEEKTARKVFETFNTVFRTGRPSRTFDWRLIRKDGTKRYIETSISLVTDSKKRPMGFRGLARDVTEIRQSENALQESEKKYRTIVDNTPDLLYRTDMEGIIVFISSSVYPLSGYTVDEAIGMKMAQEVYAFPEERQAFLDLIKKNGRVTNFEARLKRKDGSIWWAATNAQFYTDQEGRIAGVEGITRDISDQKKIEKALRESEEKFRLAFMTSPDSINMNRLSDGKYLDINSGFTNIMGYTREDVMSKTSLELNIWADAKDRDRLVSELRSKGIVKNFEAKFLTKDGSIRLGSLSARIIRVENEDVILSVVRDITEQRRTQEVLIQSEKMLSVGGLAAGMAHEINNPLAGMMQNAQVIAKRLSPDLPANRKAADKFGISMDAVSQYMADRKIFDLIDSMRNAGNRAAGIVSNILAFSRKADAGPVEINIKELVENTLEIAGSDYDLKKRIDFKKIKIIREYEETDLTIECIGGNIQQVLLNILRNAAEAMFDGKTKAPTITISLKRIETGVQMTIKDNGPGLPEGLRKRVFEPFFTTKPVGKGTGLGLSVSYFIVAQIHNGRISVASSPGQGAAFIISLPFNPNIS